MRAIRVAQNLLSSKNKSLTCILSDVHDKKNALDKHKKIWAHNLSAGNKDQAILWN